MFICIFQRLGERTQKATADANHVAEEAISSIRTVRAFACEEKEAERFEEKLAKTLKVIQVRLLIDSSNDLLNVLVESPCRSVTLFIA